MENAFKKLLAKLCNTFLVLLCISFGVLLSGVSVYASTCGAGACPEIIGTGNVFGASINSLGEVYWSQPDNQNYSQIYSSSRGQLTSDSVSHNFQAANNFGDLVWSEYSNTSPSGYTLRGIIAGKSVIIATSPNWFGKADINDRGEVVWIASDNNNITQLFSNLRGQLTYGPSSSFDPSINTQGDVVFVRFDTSVPGPGQVYMISAGAPDAVAITNNNLDHRSPVINKVGEIVWAERDPNNQTFAAQIISNMRGVLVPPVNDIFLVDLNNCGDIVYLAATPNSPTLYRLGSKAPCVSFPLPNDSPSQASQIAFGSILTGLADTATNRVDWYRFEAAAGDTINVTVNYDNRPPNLLTIGLYDGQGHLFSGPTTSAPLGIQARAVFGGIHYLKVEAQGGRFGYSLSLSKYAGNCGAGPCPEIVASGNVWSASLNSLGEVVWSQPDSQNNAQIHSSTRGQLTSDPVSHNFAATNNLGDLIWSEYSNSYPSGYALRGIIAGQSVTIAAGPNWIGKADINDRGEVVWMGSDNTNTPQVFSNLRGQLTFGQFGAFEPSINNRGDVVYVHSDPAVPGPGQVYMISAGGTAAVAITNNSFEHRSPVINDMGEVVWAERDPSSTNFVAQVVSNMRGVLVPPVNDIFLVDQNNCGDLVYIAATPNAPTLYRLGSNAPCMTPPDRSITLTVSKVSDTSSNGMISSNPTGIVLSSLDQIAAADFPSATVVTLTASPDVVSEFTGWSGACTGTAPCVVNLTAATNVVAHFSLRLVPIELNSSVYGTIVGPATVPYWGTASYTFSPAAGCYLIDVQVDGVSKGAIGSYTLENVTSLHSISAVFGVTTYNVFATAGTGGSVKGAAVVNYGNSASYVITPGTGYHVTDVVVDGVSVGAVTNYNFSNVTADHTISASFALNTYAISAIAGANGIVSGPTMVNYGGTASFVIKPAVGYHIANVEVDGISVGAVSSYNYISVTTNHAISASFVINTYSISSTAGANGTLTGPGTVNYGSSANFTIIPSAGYRVSGVVVDGVGVGAVSSYSFTNVMANHTISASYISLADLLANSVTGSSNVNIGKNISVSAKVYNQGGSNAGLFTVSFHLSKDITVSTGDVFLGKSIVPSLNVGGMIAVNGNFTVPSGTATGRYYVVAVVDSDSTVAELNESNNSKASVNTTTVR